MNIYPKNTCVWFKGKPVLWDFFMLMTVNISDGDNALVRTPVEE